MAVFVKNGSNIPHNFKISENLLWKKKYDSKRS